jgi:phage baseplate assembly protein W
MPQYYGYSSINANKPKTTNAISGADGGPGGIRQPIYWGKKFTLVDEQLVIQDFINAFNIKLGSKVGKPGYGTTLWDYVFENQTQETERGILNEIQRVCGGDPRIFLNDVQLFPQENGLLIQLQVTVVPTTDAERLSIFFDQQQRRASYI